MRRIKIVRIGIIPVLAAELLILGSLGGCGSVPEPSVPPAVPGSPTAPASPDPVLPTDPTQPTAPGLPPAPPLPLPQPQPPADPIRPQPGLDAQDRALLAHARRIGAQWVVLLVATGPQPIRPGPGGPDPHAPDHSAAAAAQIEQLGGVIGTSSPGPGYLRATVPTVNVERVAALPVVTAVDIEQVVSPHNPYPTG